MSPEPDSDDFELPDVDEDEEMTGEEIMAQIPKSPSASEPQSEDDDIFVTYDKIEKDDDGIYLNSKNGGEYKYLSNFYGGVEICFMQKRYKHPKMKAKPFIR